MRMTRNSLGIENTDFGGGNVSFPVFSSASREYFIFVGGLCTGRKENC
jgi:hypothetical protein